VNGERFALQLVEPASSMTTSPGDRQRCGRRPRVLLAEIDVLEGRGVDTSRLKVSATPT